MSTDDSLPMADDYVTKVDQWLTTTDLTDRAEPGEPVQFPPPGAPVTVVRPVRLPYELDALVKALARGGMSSLIRGWIAAGLSAAGQVPDPVTEIRHSPPSPRRPGHAAEGCLTQRAFR